MKKYVLGMGLIFLMMIMAACGGSKETNGSADGGTLKAIKDKGEIHVAIEGAYPPYNYINKSNELEGFDVEIANEVAKRLGVKPVLVATPWDSMIPALIGKKFDIIISDMAITEERKKKVSFSDNYFTTGNQLFVPNNSSIKTAKDMKGKAIGVTISTTAAEMATKNGADVKLYKNDFLAFEDLAAGRLNGVATDQGVGAKIIIDQKYSFKAIDGLLNTEKAGMTIRKEDHELRKEINKVIADMQKDGSFEAISKKWFGKDIR
ncbi:transporter substrate-binding domain-containing protein [Neobacillus citreus]|uniref:Transporter substrate-binding domain-containing protein n=1 Tax=Neobacillus citreus TaxID=2833578 RepID=A0A942SVH4_9BACI|nr:transporter substrate-binding domain-containing protein [Neobacillus citreus]MCH6264177.1 transporter substrate-binding domain-containing protein [Neobacillus citreus]